MSEQSARPRRRQRLARRIRQFRMPTSGLTIGLVVAALLAAGYVLWRSPSAVPEAHVPVRFFQIATGSTAGTYYPVGEMIATVISEPVGGEPCTEQERCGVPGLLAVVKSSQGSIANARSVSSGTYDAALAQADIAHLAFRGEGPFARSGPLENLSAIAGLFPEAVHLVAAADSGIESVKDLRGKRVSIDRAGSGTQADALLIMRAFGLRKSSVKAHEEEPSAAVDKIIAGELDAFFLIAGTPAAAVSELIDSGVGRLIPISGPPVADLHQNNPFFVEYTIPAGTYTRTPSVATLSVKSLLLTRAEQPGDLVHDITAALWRPGNRAALDEGHVKGREIRLESALDGVSIPFHPGAERYYRAAGML